MARPGFIREALAVVALFAALVAAFYIAHGVGL